MNPGLFHTDSAIAAKAVEDTFNTKELHYMHDPGYPGYVAIITVFYAIDHYMTGTESSEFVLNFASVLFGAIGVMILYIFTKELTGSRLTGVIASLILTVLPIYLSLSTYAKDHTMEISFVLLSAYLILKAGKTDSLKLKIISSLLLGYAITIRITNFLFIPILFLLYWHSNFPLALVKKGELIKIKLRGNIAKLIEDIFLLLIPMFIVFLILYMPKIRQFGIQPFISISQYAKFLGFFSQLLPLSIMWTTVSVTYLGYILIALGILVLFFIEKQQRYTGAILLLWMLVFFEYYANITTTSDRYIIPALIPATIIMAIGINWIYNRFGNLPMLITFIILIGLMANNIYPIISYRHQYSGQKEFSLKVKELTEPNSKIIVMDDGPLITYYTKRDTIGHTIDGDDNKIEGDMRTISNYLDSGIPIYIVSTGFSYDAGDGLAYDQYTRQFYNSVTGETYPGIFYDPITRTISDNKTNIILPLTGKWQLELLSRFKLRHIATIENEDYHHAGIMLSKFPEDIYKIEKF